MYVRYFSCSIVPYQFPMGVLVVFEIVSICFLGSLESNTTRAARAAQGCTDDSVSTGAGSLMCE